MHEIRADVAVVGAGTAGLAAYRAATAAGKRALIIEGGPYGTTCARVGCMPSKLLIAAAEAAHGPSRWEELGLRLHGKLEVDGHAVMARVKRERRPLRRIRPRGRRIHPVGRQGTGPRPLRG